MVELQSCATLVNASALCGIEQEVRGESVNIVVAEISAELQRERQKNAELMQRISILEAQIRERNNEEETTIVTDTGQGNYQQHEVARNIKRFKRRKLELVADAKEEGNKDHFKSEMALEHKADAESRLVNWMSIDDTQNLHLERFKDSDSVADFDETESDDECNDNYDDHDDVHNDHRNGEFDARQDEHEHQKMNEVKTLEGKATEENGGNYTAATLEGRSLGSASVSQRKPLKVAFCPKEVKKIIESEALLQNNAQSHTIRKIIVFASLGLRHGSEEMYELDFNHFSILKKGEPYVSPRNPGEHVLYENPGVRRKIFYPNRKNPILCPVQILEEERAMRPSDASCPSYLFLCIKYGGRTRNLPQNEYVRQRMGRNKLKSFGPLMCRKAMLVHIRSGSFFFKALGITLLFMAGFPDDIVQRETKYRNLDLLQKYYRTDEDAAEEELFLPHPIAYDTGTPEPQSLTKKSHPAKSRGKKHTNSISKSHNLQKTPSGQSNSASSAPSQFGLTCYSSAHTLAMAAFNSIMPSQISPDTSQVTNNHPSYHMLPPQPTSAYVPIVYWPPPPSAFPYGYQSFPSTSNYISFHTQPYYNHPTCSGKNEVAYQTDSDSDSSNSGGIQQKQRSAICK